LLKKTKTYFGFQEKKLKQPVKKNNPEKTKFTNPKGRLPGHAPHSGVGWTETI